MQAVCEDTDSGGDLNAGMRLSVKIQAATVMADDIRKQAASAFIRTLNAKNLYYAISFSAVVCVFTDNSYYSTITNPNSSLTNFVLYDI